MENEKYGVELVADTSQFKQSIREISQMVKALSKQIQKINHIPFKLGVFNNNVNSDNKKATSNEIFEETKRYTQLTRLIERAQNSVGKYDNRINQLKKDMEDLAVESEKTFEQVALLKELDLKADSGEAFTPAEGVLYSQLGSDRDRLENAEKKYYDTIEKNQEKLNELVQRRIIAEQQLNALKEKREKEASSGTTEEQVQKLQEEVDKLKNKYNDLRKSAHGSIKDLGNIFDRSIGKIKRFTFYLLGARSVFSLFMKYQSIYYQYNEQMQYQSELSQNAIALSLAPAFELLGNVMTYASIAFAKFIELLTGVNVLSKVSTKGIREYNKSLKETQTLVSGIDEITNLTNPQNLGLAGQYQALKEFQEKVKEVEEFFKKNEWIQDLADGLKIVWGYLKDTYTYIKNHWDVFKYLIGGVAIGLAITSPVGKIALIIGATINLVNWLKKLAEKNDAAKDATDRLRESEQKLKKFREEQKDAEDEYIEAVDNKTEAMNKLSEMQEKTGQSGEELYKKVQSGKILYEDLSDDLKELYKSYRDYKIASDKAFNANLKFRSSTIKVNSELTKQKGAMMEINKEYDEDFKDLMERYRKGEITAREFTLSVESYMEGMSDEYKKSFIFSLPDDVKQAFAEVLEETQQTTVFKDMKRVFTDSKFELSYKEVAESIKKDFGSMAVDVSKSVQKVIDKLNELKRTKVIDNKIINIGVKYGIKKSDVQNLINKVRGISVNLFGMPEKTFNNIASNILKNFGYAKGLDYVPYDNYPAILHKGEAVVPAKYNPTIHSEGNDYTNSLLETLIVKVEDLANRPNEFNIDGQKLARATYPLLQAEGRNYRYNEGVSR